MSTGIALSQPAKRLIPRVGDTDRGSLPCGLVLPNQGHIVPLLPRVVHNVGNKHRRLPGVVGLLRAGYPDISNDAGYYAAREKTSRQNNWHYTNKPQ